MLRYAFEGGPVDRDKLEKSLDTISETIIGSDSNVAVSVWTRLLKPGFVQAIAVGGSTGESTWPGPFPRVDRVRDMGGSV